jgi:DNA-binding response OmpR family regulator
MTVNRKRVIYVNDIINDLLSMKIKLKAHFEVYLAASFEKMFETLEHTIPDVILIDVIMTKEECSEIVATLKADSRYADVPIVLIASQQDKEPMFSTSESNMVFYVNRLYSIPSTIEQIGEIIASCNPLSSDDSTPTPSIANERKKIIYINDTENDFSTMKEVLSEHYDVCVVKSTENFSEIFENINPAAVLFGTKLPQGDVDEPIFELSTNELYAGIPIIFLTVQHDQGSLFKSLKLDIAAYVNKPFSTSYLIEQIKDVVKFDESQISTDESVEENTNKDSKGGEKVMEDNPNQTKHRILAIDDVAILLRTIHHALRDDYDVYTLTNPQKLGEFLLHTTPDLFLLDYNMPVLSGFDLVPIIRSYPAHKETPIIFITAEKTATQISAAVNLGACDYIIKPFKDEVLREKVAFHLRDEAEND